jgi:hypothetical protein
VWRKWGGGGGGDADQGRRGFEEREPRGGEKTDDRRQRKMVWGSSGRSRARDAAFRGSGLSRLLFDPGAVHPGLKKRERSIVQFSVLVFDHFDQSNFEVNFAKSIFSFLIKPQVFWLVSLKSGLTRCVDVPNQRAVFLSVFIFYFHIFLSLLFFIL